MTPDDYPQGLPKEVLEVWERRLLEEIRTAVQGRISDVARGAEPRRWPPRCLTSSAGEFAKLLAPSGWTGAICKVRLICL